MARLSKYALSDLSRIVALALVLMAVTTAAPIAAQDDSRLDDLFTIRDIQVDVEARSAAAARLKAIEEVEERGYATLIAKLTRAEDREKLPELDRQARLSLISGLEVVREQTSSRRYIAVYNIRFEPDLVSEHLAFYGVPHVFGAGGRVTVMHAHERDGILYFWSPDSVIATGRAAVDWGNRIRQYAFLSGDLETRLALTADQVIRLDEAAGEMLLAADQETVPLMVATRWSSADQTLVYSASLARSSLAFEGRVDGENEAQAIGTALSRIVDGLDDDWRARLLVDVSASGSVELEVETAQLEDWTRMTDALKRISLVRSYRPVSIGLPLSLVAVDYAGRLDQLTVAMEELGFTVTEIKDARLRIRGGAGLR